MRPSNSHTCFGPILTALLAGPLLNASAAPPAIQTQPEDQTVTIHGPAVLSVSAEGTPPLLYQWLKDGVDVSGGTNHQLTIDSTRFPDAGRYSLVVSNLDGSVTSNAATLSITPPTAGAFDYSLRWDLQPLINGSIRCVLPQPDGKIVIGGNLSSTGQGLSRSGVIRLNPDGSLDESFSRTGAGAEGEIRAIALQKDGKILIGGNFGTVNGTARGNFARLNSDGSLDGLFQSRGNGVGVPPRLGAPEVDALAVQADGRILIGGWFWYVDGQRATAIARLNPDGSLDPSFQVDLDGPVLAIADSSAGKLVIGGAFRTINGMPRHYVARLNANGAIDNTFTNGLLGPDSLVNSIAMAADGHILIAGEFTSVDDEPHRLFARLNPDGSLDKSFDPFPVNGEGGCCDQVHAMALQSDGRALIAGVFWVPGHGGFYVARFNLDGTLDDSYRDYLGAFLDQGMAIYVASLAIQADGRILAAGMSTKLGKSQGYIGRIWGSSNLSPEFLTLSARNDGLHLGWDAIPGRTYQVQFKPNLSGSNWTSLGSDVVAWSSGQGEFVDQSKAQARFYRVALHP